MNSKPLAFASAVVFVLTLGTGLAMSEVTSPAADPAAGSVESVVSAYQAAFQAAREGGNWPSAEARGAMADEALNGLDTAALSLDELDTLLNGVPVAYSAIAETCDAALVRLAKSPTAEGARAEAMRFRLLGQETTQAQRADRVRDLFKHPGLAQAWQQQWAYDVFNSFYWLDKDQLDALHPDFVALAPMVGPQMPADFLTRMSGAYFAFANSAEGDVALAQAREPLRVALIGAIDAGLDNGELSEEQSKALSESRARLDGAYARGQLVGHTAPELHFTWWSNPTDPDESYAKLSDLKGKVVVLDFWATWCGPCVGSFPHVKELQSHYDGYDVVIVGVTSLQGAHFTGDERGKIDCADDPDQERALMKEFMAAKDVTWRVAFAEEPVFNPDYGVNGIPHVAILDPQGVVRFRGLHPAMPMQEKTSRIDQLLAEAGKPVPPAAESADEAVTEPTPQGGE